MRMSNRWVQIEYFSNVFKISDSNGFVFYNLNSRWHISCGVSEMKTALRVSYMYCKNRSKYTDEIGHFI